MSGPGAPTIYTEQLALSVCERIAGGESLRKICLDDDMPAMRTVMKWLSDGKHAEFVQQYAHAREIQAETMAEDILSIADDGTNDTSVGDDGRVAVNHDVIARSRLRVDARKWLASKMAPKKYGDRIQQDVNHSGEINTVSDERLESRILELAGKAGIAVTVGGKGPEG